MLEILDGLSDEALRRLVLPSGWTCVGLVRHLALDVERFWFRTVVAGEPAGAVFGLYRDEIARADAILAGTSLDAVRELIDGRTWMVV